MVSNRRAVKRILAVLLVACLNETAGASVSSEKIPLEYCDIIPVVRVSIDRQSFRLLVDTAATSVLNLKSFSGGGMKAIQISSWTGPVLTSARQVIVEEMFVGSHRVASFRLPAIDLSPISKACGGAIDGIMGVDLLERIGARLDLKENSATLTIGEEEQATGVLEELEVHRVRCTEAFNRKDLEGIADCFDPEFVLYSEGSEVRGRKEMIRYLNERYFLLDPGATLELSLEDHRSVGDAVWFGYDLKIVLNQQLVTMHGMAICRKSGDRWRLLNMHNSTELRR